MYCGIVLRSQFGEQSRHGGGSETKMEARHTYTAEEKSDDSLG
jgi:hypothetical protein